MIPPGRWDRVRDLFDRALACPAEQRAAFLQAECGGDDELRAEVESLLAAYPSAEGFLSPSPLKDGSSGEGRAQASPIAPGSRLGSFEVLEPLGAGGMGEVYHARDTRLDRHVALKVLTAELAGDPRGVERFEREARLISKLTHPKICTLFDVGAAVVDGREVRYLVMELLDGETLAARLRRGPVAVPEAVDYAIQIVGALAAAHAAGVVHRDLKPANIMLTKSGVKLLDFGLARLRPSTIGGAPPEGRALDDSLTVHGLMMGTLPYMAPEQVRGHEVDARADLFAFGAVLYEMLTGARAFEGDSEAELIAAILERDPVPLDVRQPLVPAALERLVTACLARNPAERWQHAHDVELELKTIATGIADGTLPLSRSRGRRGARPAAAWRLHGAWAAVVLVVAAALWWFRPAAPDPAPPPNPRPVVVLMDSPLAGRVYDPRTLAAGGTNADDVSDALRDLPVLTQKENTSPMWHREEQVRRENPDLIISHLSCLFDARAAAGDQELYAHLFDLAQNRLTLFFGYLAAVNPRTRFLVYSRGRFTDPQVASAWVDDVVARFPRLDGRLFTMSVPGGEARATFRDPPTAALLRRRVKEILRLP